uniref:Uncharacterized protein n=1 Tax=Labrus bergylta TaxID=56723 RepID=A0A3Q3FU36_9LABR
YIMPLRGAAATKTFCFCKKRPIKEFLLSKCTGRYLTVQLARGFILLQGRETKRIITDAPATCSEIRVDLEQETSHTCFEEL